MPSTETSAIACPGALRDPVRQRRASVPGRISANSSPPIRAAVSVARTTPRSALPTALSTSSPYGCPCASLTALKLSRSSITSASGALTAAGLLQLGGQDLVEAAMVGQPGERVGRRQAPELHLVPVSHGQKRRRAQQADAAEGQQGHAVHADSRERDDARPEERQPTAAHEQHAAAKRTRRAALMARLKRVKGRPGQARCLPGKHIGARAFP